MVHIYCGDGKGKTTCSMGLAVRSAGRGNRVVIAQFLKDGDSGERVVLGQVPGVTLLEAPEKMKFTFTMNEEEKAAERVRQTEQFRRASGMALAGECDLLVLDEMCSAVSTGMVDLALVTDFLDRMPKELEVVMTGRNPHQDLQDRADYITEMKKIRHPYDKGVASRVGVEK